MGNTVKRPGGDAAVIRVGETKALALATDCTPRYCRADPIRGGMQAVAESWRNLTAVGALPLALTDNMNFGNPERPEIMGQFVGAIEGMRAACLALDYPVVSGQCVAVQRDERQCDPADARCRRRRADRRSAQRRRPRTQTRRKCSDPDRRNARSPRRLALSARDRGDRRPDRRLRSISQPSAATAILCAPKSPPGASRPAMTCPMAVSSSHSPRWRWPVAAASFWNPFPRPSADMRLSVWRGPGALRHRNSRPRMR